MNDDEKRRIEEEEGYRAKVRKDLEAKEKGEKPKRKMGPMGCGCLTVIALLVIGGWLSSLSGPSEANAQTQAAEAAAREAQRQEAEGPYTDIDVRINCERVIKDRLVAPSTAKFPGIFSDDRTDPRRYQDHPDGPFWAWTTVVDAQNGFGAMLRGRWNCRVYDDGRITVEQWE